MLCQNCGENEANVKYTQIINGVKKQMNICDKCAKELGIEDISFNMPINFSNFLGGMFDDYIEDFIPSLIKPETLLCDKCGSSYDEFIQSGKFGCDECYDTFNNQIDTLLKNIHGVNRHVGRNGRMLKTKQENNEKIENAENKKQQAKVKDKEVKEQTKEDKIAKLQEQLKQEIKEERYEDAAKTRDEIRKLNNI